MSAKLIILIVLSFLAGIIFLGFGYYFLSTAFVNKMKEAYPDKSAEGMKKCEFKCRGSGFVTIFFGMITLFWAVLLLIFKDFFPILALIYMALLAIAFLALMVIFK